jgi:hypothetical protein
LRFIAAGARLQPHVWYFAEAGGMYGVRRFLLYINIYGEEIVALGTFKKRVYLCRN